MSRQKHRERLHRLLQLLQQHRMGTVQQTAQHFGCHASSIERLLARLRLEGYEIRYDRSMKRYQLEPKK